MKEERRYGRLRESDGHGPEICHQDEEQDCQTLFPPSLRGWDTKIENEVIFLTETETSRKSVNFHLKVFRELIYEVNRIDRPAHANVGSPLRPLYCQRNPKLRPWCPHSHGRRSAIWENSSGNWEPVLSLTLATEKPADWTVLTTVWLTCGIHMWNILICQMLTVGYTCPSAHPVSRDISRNVSGALKLLRYFMGCIGKADARWKLAVCRFSDNEDCHLDRK